MTFGLRDMSRLPRGAASTRKSNGMWVTTLSGPDGYRIHFESETDAPEESVYSG